MKLIIDHTYIALRGNEYEPTLKEITVLKETKTAYLLNILNSQYEETPGSTLIPSMKEYRSKQWYLKSQFIPNQENLMINRTNNTINLGASPVYKSSIESPDIWIIYEDLNAPEELEVEETMTATFDTVINPTINETYSKDQKRVQTINTASQG